MKWYICQPFFNNFYNINKSQLGKLEVRGTLSLSVLTGNSRASNPNKVHIFNLVFRNNEMGVDPLPSVSSLLGLDKQPVVQKLKMCIETGG